MLALTTQPSALVIRDSLIGNLLAIEIEAHEIDRPRLIGSQGKHIAAFTRIMKAMGANKGIEVVIDLIVPRNRPRNSQPQKPFQPNQAWKPIMVTPLLKSACQELFGSVGSWREHELTNMTVFEINSYHPVVSALDTWFEAVGYLQGRVVHITGPKVKIL